MATQLVKKKAAPKKVVKKRVVKKPTRKSPWSYRLFNQGNDITFFKNDEYISEFNLENKQTLECSCGVVEIEGISDLERCMEDEGVPQYIIKEALKKFIEELKHRSAAFIIASNNQSTPIINRILDSISHKKTDWKLNPNSGSTIRVWIL